MEETFFYFRLSLKRARTRTNRLRPVCTLSERAVIFNQVL